jgi:hypothetical protein
VHCTKVRLLMSTQGQKRQFSGVPVTSASTPTATRNSGHQAFTSIPSHPITRRVAIGQGFQQVHGETALYKIALGQPVTQSTWNKGRLSIERLTGMKLQHVCPQYDSPVELTMEDGKAMNIQLFDLETILSPTIFAFPKRKAVIVPITRAFAADLLGTDDQYSFLEVPEAHFLTRRTYFNTTRAARVMVPGAAIAFYESLGGGGRGAVVALARIVDVTSVPKDRMPNILQRGAVVDDVGTLIRAARVLATTFDNLVILRRPVPFKTLRKIGCVTGANFVSATSIADKHLTAIIDAGG